MDISEFKQSITNILSVDVETFEHDDKSPNPFTNDLKGVGFGSNEASQIYLVYNEDNRSAIQELLSLPTPKLGHNIKFDVITLRRHGFNVNGDLEDSYILAKCFGYYEKTALKDMVEQLFNLKSPKITELINKYKQIKGNKKGTINDVPAEVLAEYCKNDCKYTIMLYKYLTKHWTPEVKNLYDNIEKPLIPMLIEAEMKGIALDIGALQVLGDKLWEDIQVLRCLIWEFVGYEFNINSGQQLGNVLYKKLGYPIFGYTKLEKMPKTDEYTLGILSRNGYEFASWIAKFKELSTLASKFLYPYREMVKRDGRVHCTMNQVGADTGRFSCGKPNLQQVPKVDKKNTNSYGSLIRSMFIPDKGKILISGDYKQMELYVAAHLTQEPSYIQPLRDGKDLHDDTALKLSLSREDAKTTNFAILYGTTEYGLARSLHIAVPVAKAILDGYDTAYPYIHCYGMDGVAQLYQCGYVTTMYGRHRYVDTTKWWKQELYARALNSPIQGSCADIIKVAMGRIRDKIKPFGADFLLQIHDELLFQCPIEAIEEVKCLIKYEMENVVELTVPLQVEVATGYNWAELK